jgi:HNH endonuclease
MNLKSISDSDLLVQIKNLAGEERRITTEVLLHLREIEARHLFAELGFSSLYEYCTKELGYSESSAWRRISAMRLLKDVPEIEEQLLDGRMTVTTLSQVQSFLLQEKKQKNEFTKDEKLELLGQVEGMSTRETERVLATISPQSALPDRERYISGNEIEIRFTASRELIEKLNRLKGLLAHNRETQSYAGLLEALADLALRKLDPVEKFKRKTKIRTKPFEKVKAELESQTDSEMDSSAHLNGSGELSSPPAPKRRCVMGRAIPCKLYDKVWERDEGKCSFSSPATGRRCNSTHALEIDHIWPFALGGETELGNLRLLCRQHNQFSAIQIFGKERMKRYLSPSRSR